MARTRRKAPKQEAPQTIEQAVALLNEYRDLTDKIDELGEETLRAIAHLKGEYDTFAAPLTTHAQDLFRQLRAWWGVAAPELTEGKRKSIELAGCMIGERTTPPSLALPKGAKVEEIVDKLLNWLGGDFIVTTHKLDKPAIIKLLRQKFDEDAADVETLTLLAARDVLTEELKLAVAQKEEFFIDRPGKAPDPEVVPEAPEPADA